ncbi:interleukin-3 receptor subunit alpha-like isoform X2 [Grammomys surdaster]|uniref:interleukin-3 receptor subunit alpha-like isoform X2 n=1 Tax=Grammomys surdaster TaxID=491861 RepID=UPI00109FF6A8|nr:interleukin-3 receptor subunit alpha-like isoform X2 [Grammomys surdaster]
MDSALWLLLGGVACTLTLEQAINIETTAPPIRNLRINPAQQMLTWELEGGASSSGMTFICHKDGRNARIDLDGQLQCSFQSVSLCHVTNYSVFPEKHEDMVASILFPTSDPNRGAAARDLHCWVHDVQRMTCRWGRGPAAPEDVRYRMFWRDAEEGPEQDRECPHYDLRERGANLGCVLDDVPLLENLMMVTVKGSSGAGAVSCSDTAVNLGFVEILTPPTLTAECNSSEAHVQWAMQSKFNTGFEYKLQYNQSSHPEPQEQPLNVPHFRLLNPGTVSFRVSATLVTGGKPSPWSNTQHLVCGPVVAPVMLISLLLAVAGVGLTALAALLLCRRKSVLARLFPPIPRMRVRLEAGPGEMVAWGETEDCEVTPVTDA